MKSLAPNNGGASFRAGASIREITVWKNSYAFYWYVTALKPIHFVLIIYKIQPELEQLLFMAISHLGHYDRSLKIPIKRYVFMLSVCYTF